MANLYYFLDMRHIPEGGKGTLKIAISHMRKVAHHSLNIRLTRDEWDADLGQIVNRTRSF